MEASLDAFSKELYERAHIKSKIGPTIIVLPSYLSAKMFTFEQIKTSRMLNVSEVLNIISFFDSLPIKLKSPNLIATPAIETKQPIKFYEQNYDWLKRQTKILHPLSKYIGEEKIVNYLPWIKLHHDVQEIENIQGGFFTLNTIVYFKYPSKISIINGKLHNSKDAAIEFEHGLKLYYLNNVNVPKELVTTDEDKIDILSFIKKYKNVEIRRELLRKVGIDRFVHKTQAQIIDSWLDYELLRLHIPDIFINPIVLKMKNPSIECYHVEGVPSYIKTVQEALTWRCNGFTWNPKQLT